MLSLAVGLGTAATCYVGMTGNLHSPLLFLLGGISSILVTAVGAMCDQRSRVLPFGLSIATYPLAVLTAFGHGGVSGLIGNQMRSQMDETGKSITQWFSKARNTAGAASNNIK